jgi:nicotinamidase-related amidase
MKASLFVIDMQKKFFNYDDVTSKSLNDAIGYINYAIGIFRKKGLPVISIQHKDEESGLVPGNEGFEMSEKLNLLTDDIHIIKTYGNAFNKTGLADKLKELGVDTVIITGFCAEGCVLSTYRGAEDVGLTPVILRNSLASPSLENIKFVESVNSIISAEILEKFV